MQARLAALVVGVEAWLAGEQHARPTVRDDDARLHRGHFPPARGLGRCRDTWEGRELLEVLDRRKDELQPLLGELVERVLRADPAEVDALRAVNPRLGAKRSLDNEEPGVEARLHLGRSDPARE